VFEWKLDVELSVRSKWGEEAARWCFLALEPNGDFALEVPSEWIGDLIRKWRSASVQPSLFPAPSDRPMPEAIKEVFGKARFSAGVCARQLLFFRSFEFFIEITIGGTTHLGYPKRAIRDRFPTPSTGPFPQGAQRVARYGTKFFNEETQKDWRSWPRCGQESPPKQSLSGALFRVI
jgi:hypothetical protein